MTQNMPQHSTSTELATTDSAAPRTRSIRTKLRSAGIIAVAAAFVGSIALPAVALQPQESAPQDFLATASQTQTLEVETSAGMQSIAVPASDSLEWPTEEEFAEIQAEAAAAEQARIDAENAAAEEAAATQDAGTTEAVEAADETPAAPVQDGPASASAGSIVGIAQSQLGKPYVFGATGPDAFDCSGFTQWVYAQVGVALPRDATTQASVGTPVSSPQPGDLLVWSGHVAIYVGNDTIIHSATPSSGVKYTPYSAMVASMGQPQIRRF